MLLRVALVMRTDVSEKFGSSFITVTRIGDLETTRAVTSNRRALRRNTKLLQEPHGVTSQKTAFLIVTAVKTSNLTFHRHCHKYPPRVHIMSQIDSNYTIPSYLRSILILSSVAYVDVLTDLPAVVSTKILSRFLSSPYVLLALPIPFWLYLVKNIVLKLLIMHISPAPVTVILCLFNMCSQTPSVCEECRLLGHKTPVRTSQETPYVSTTESSQLMLCKIWCFHGSDYEELCLLGYNNPVRTSQESHYFSTTESSQLMLCKIWGFHGSDYEEWRLLGFYALVRIDVSEERNASIIKVTSHLQIHATAYYPSPFLTAFTILNSLLASFLIWYFFVACVGFKLRLKFLVHRLSPRWWRRYVPPKCRFLQETHGITSQKTPILHSHRRENLRSYPQYVF
jgi:hypothetical protein